MNLDRLEQHPPDKTIHEGDRMPIDVLSAEQIINMDQEQCWQRLRDAHGIDPATMFKREPGGKKWSKDIITKIVLARLEGATSGDILFELRNQLDEQGNDVKTDFNNAYDLYNIGSIMARYCKDEIYIKIKEGARTYQLNNYKMREFPASKLQHILETLKLSREELFNDNKKLGTIHGKITVPDLLWALDLRMQGLNYEEIVSRFIGRGIESFSQVGTKVAANDIAVLFNKNFSPKTRMALREYLKTKGIR